MNFRPFSGPHAGVKREEGDRLTFAQALDRAVPWLLAGAIVLNVSVLSWLCLGQITLQQQVAVILERTTTQNQTARQNTDDIRGLLTAQAELQREVEDLKDHR